MAAVTEFTGQNQVPDAVQIDHRIIDLQTVRKEVIDIAGVIGIVRNVDIIETIEALSLLVSVQG